MMAKSITATELEKALPDPATKMEGDVFIPSLGRDSQELKL